MLCLKFFKRDACKNQTKSRQNPDRNHFHYSTVLEEHLPSRFHKKNQQFLADKTTWMGLGLNSKFVGCENPVLYTLRNRQILVYCNIHCMFDSAGFGKKRNNLGLMFGNSDSVLALGLQNYQHVYLQVMNFLYYCAPYCRCSIP